MATRDVELVKMVGNYLIAHANLNYVDLQDMVDTIQASSYRYSRMKKQVFSNLVRKAYQVYCQQNNLAHDAIPGSSGSPHPASPDSDVEIEENPPSTAMKNQMTNLYMSPKATEGTPAKPPMRLPFRPAFEVPPSRAGRKPGQSVPSPTCSDVSSKSDDDDLEIIEEVHQQPKNRNGTLSTGESRAMNINVKTLPATVVQTLQPIVKNIGIVSSVSSPTPTTTTPAESSRTPSVNVDMTKTSGNPTPTIRIALNDVDEQRVDKRGIKRKLDTPEGISPLTPALPSILRTTKPKQTKADSGSNFGLAAGTPYQKTKKQVTVVHDSGVTFSDFGGNDKIIEEICKLLMHLKHPEIYRELGVVPPRGFLLHGAPGCGKTLLANAIAGELKMPLLKVAATELISGISGESENNIRDLFDQGISLAPCIIFIDEIDSITPKRENAQREMERRIVSQLLTCIDELGNKVGGDQVLLIGATNRIETIDAALRRAGRFDREICLGIPDTKAREQILRVLFRNLRLSPNFDFSLLAKLTPGYVGADLQALMREAAVQSVDKALIAQRPIVVPAASVNVEAVPISETRNEGTNVESKVDDEKQVENGNEAKDKQTQETSNENDQPIDDKQPSNNEPMEVDTAGTLKSSPLKNASSTPAVTSAPEPVPIEKDFFKWIRDTAPLSERNLGNLCLHMEDFQKALKYVQPSSKREGFATVPDTTWDDIGALTEIREELQVSILGPVKHASAFQSLGLNSPAGVLLCGPPGCGKTLLAKAVANEAGINFISVKGPELLNMYVGESERAVRQCFLRAKNSSPCVIFFDELDALCPRRSEGIESGSTSRVVNQLLTEMDGMESRAGVFVMAATNRPDIIDPAILRPGRLDKVIFVNLPTPDDRLDILKAITNNGAQPRFAEDVDLKLIALSDKLDGFTGADLAAIVREASIAAFRELVLEAGKSGKPICADDDLKVYSRHFDTALLRTKPSVTVKDREKYTLMKERYSSLLT